MSPSDASPPARQGARALRRGLLLTAACLGLGAGLARGAEPVEWRAQWIWGPGSRTPRNAYLYLRRSFVLPGRVERAIAHVTADSRYALYVNGRLVARGPARCDPQHQFYATLDLRRALRPGQNAVAALVHHMGVGTASYVPGAAGFLFQADIVSAGERVQLQTDETWRAHPSDAWHRGVPRMNAQLGFPEVFDARREPVGWRAAAFDDYEWKPATVIGPALGTKPWGALLPRPIPLLRATEVAPAEVIAITQSRGPTPAPDAVAPGMAAEAHKPPAEGALDKPTAALRRDGQCATLAAAPGTSVSLVLDFGREVSGVPRIVIAKSQGGILDVGYAEALEDGRVNPTRGGIQYADRCILRPGALTWEPFDQRAFRYLQLSFRELPGPVQLDSVSLDLVTYPVRRVGSFRSSDELLNRIWAVGAYTCELCMQDAFIDCPWRERAQWWGDARIEMLVNYHASGDRLLPANGLRQIAWSQQPDGRVLALYPAASHGAPSFLADYAAIWVSSLRDHWWFAGDDGPMRDAWPQVRRLFEWFAARTNALGLLADVPGWVFIDTARVEKRGECGPLNAFYYQALRDGAQMARHLGHEADAEQLQQRAARLAIAFNERLWVPEARCYADARTAEGLSANRSVHANALPVLFGIAEGRRREAAADRVARLIREEPTAHASPYFMHYVLAMLFRHGRAEVALDAIRRGWKPMLDAGATTWWEHFQPGGTWCHGWSASPTIQLPAEVLGIRPLSPGLRRVLIAPTLCGLEFAAATVPSPQGRIVVSATQEAATSTLSLEATIPGGKADSGVSATVALPKGAVERPEVRLDGKPIWVGGSLTREGQKLVRRATDIGDRIEFVVPGGRTYLFTLVPASD